MPINSPLGGIVDDSIPGDPNVDGRVLAWDDTLGKMVWREVIGVYIQPAQPAGISPYLWVQTGLGDGTGITLWVNT